MPKTLYTTSYNGLQPPIHAYTLVSHHTKHKTN
jgi:hypothetical protein